MSNVPKMIGLMALGGAAAAGAASENVPLNYFTTVVAIMGGAYTILKTIGMISDWTGAKRKEMVKEVVAEVLKEMHAALKEQADESAQVHRVLKRLPCVRSAGAICDTDGEHFANPVMP